MLIESEKSRKITEKLFEEYFSLPEDDPTTFEDLVFAKAPKWYINEYLRPRRHFEKTGARY